MPVVPRLDPQGESAGIPNARVSPDAPSGAFVSPVALDLSPAEQLFGQIVKEERAKADQVVVLDADRRMSELANTLLYDPQTGALNQHGTKAFGVPEQVHAAWTKGLGEIGASLTTEAQRISFMRLSNERTLDVTNTIQKHVSVELQQHDNAVTDASVANERSAAILNYDRSGRVTAGIARQKAMLQDYATRNGLPSEWTDEKVAQATSQTQLGVVERMLATGQDQAASAYYAEYQKDFVAGDAVSVERALEEGSTRGASQRAADKILATTNSEGAALDAVKQIDDPKIRDMTHDRVRQHYADVEGIKRQHQEDLYMSATNLLDNAVDKTLMPRDIIPPGVWSQLSLEQRSALERRQAGDVANDSGRWLKFLDLRPTQLQQMSMADFQVDYWSHFDAVHRARAEAQWSAARDGTGISEPKLSHLMGVTERVTSTLQRAGLIDKGKPLAKLSADQQAYYAKFENAAERAVNEFELTQLGGKRPAAGPEIQEILDDMVAHKVFVDRSWSRDPQFIVPFVPMDEAGQAYVPMAQVPLADKASITNYVRSAGKRVTDELIQRIEAQYWLNKETTKSPEERMRSAANSVLGITPNAAGNP